jgi:hypothetical protein
VTRGANRQEYNVAAETEWRETTDTQAAVRR